MPFKGEIGVVVETERSITGFPTFEWRISDFLSLVGERGDLYGSPHFDACDGRWRFRIYPYGISRDTPPGWVSLVLVRVDEGPPKTLDVTLGIRGADRVRNKRKRIQEVSKDDFKCHWSGFCLRSKLREQNSGLMPGNVLIFSLDMKTHVPSVARDATTETDDDLKEPLIDRKQFPGKKGVEALQKSLQSLLAGGEDSDVLIRVRGKEFPAHRAILRARSAVFQAMFTHDMVEKQSGVVTMEDCDPESFPDFLEHVYTGSVEMISSSNVFSLFTASDKYDLSTLKEECAHFMKHNLTVQWRI